MKSMIIGILAVFLVAALTQPLVEFAVVINESVALDSAIMNSCRAARNNALASVDYYYSDRIIGDLNASIEEDMFRRFFAEAFSETLGVSIIDASANPMRFGENERWNATTVWVDYDYDESGAFGSRGISSVTVEVETPYKFRTSLLQIAAVATGGTYNLGQRGAPMTFFVQIVN